MRQLCKLKERILVVNNAEVQFVEIFYSYNFFIIVINGQLSNGEDFFPGFPLTPVGGLSQFRPAVTQKGKHSNMHFIILLRFDRT